MTRGVRATLSLAYATFLLACAAPPPPLDTAGAASSAAGVPSASAPPPAASAALAAPSTTPAAPPSSPLRTGEPRERWLELPGFEPALLSLPRGAGSGPVRLVVVAHGAGGRPEPDCAHYRALLGEGDFLIACTRGTPNNRHKPEAERGYFYDGHPRLGKELAALLAALASTEPYASEVLREDAVYIGYSQGASMGILALHAAPELAAHFSAILLVEGGVAEWTVAYAERLAARRVRVALVCGQPKCSAAAERSAAWMKRAGLDHRVRSATGAGHTFQGRIGEAAKALLPWLLGQADAPADAATAE